MNKKTIAIYLGDPAGIGPEEVAKVAAEGYLQDKCNTLILGDERVFRKALALIGKSVDYLRVTREEDISFENHAICLYDLQDIDPEEITMGQIDARCGRTCIRQIDLGIELWRKHIIDGALFAAVNKAAVKAAIGEHYSSEFSYMIEALDFKGYASEVNHMDNIFTTRIVSHIPMRQMCDNITQEKVENAIRLLYTTMVKAGIKNPRIAVAALNPGLADGKRLTSWSLPWRPCGKRDILLPVPIRLIRCFSGHSVRMNSTALSRCIMTRARLH